ncbi:MAG: hypothetical protein DRQ63_05580 [Gammaproteobacteria bacterium]|nr:MAG: hypothetical protein DRQ63_05580 [Gammaproteobacteria bacterium]
MLAKNIRITESRSVLIAALDMVKPRLMFLFIGAWYYFGQGLTKTHDSTDNRFANQDPLPQNSIVS